MSKETTTHAAGSAKVKGDASATRQVLDTLQESLSFTQGWIISALPRASLNIVQPVKVPEAALKNYTAEFHREDRASWQAILRGKAVRGSDAFKDFESSRFFQAFLKPLGYRHLVAAPLKSPLFQGYPGVVQLLRGPGERDFTDSDLKQIEQVCRHADDATAHSRRNKLQDSPANGDVWTHQAPVRFGLYDSEAKPIYPAGGIELDERIEQQLKQRARQAVEQLKKGHVMADRVLLPDTWGDLWVFRGVMYADYAAAGSGPHQIFCLQPEAAEWVNIRPADVQADPEIVRLLPSLKFMFQEFHRNPTLDDISKKAHLSPFHFHRRFTDLVGQTPKHFLLSCQIIAAKRLLIARKRELAQIATDCGFAHQSHFTSRFKQATGLTPTRWRRLAAQISEGAGAN